MQELVWNEAGIVRRLKGRIKGEEGDFIVFETEYQIFKINKAVIIKIEEMKL